ncbi:MAG: ABC transporter permease [Christensenellaceae bacterium]|jgi:simple sugar transport system permease protein|nr:ABC transporter permease [Christensenellaceae bacterium]
MNITQLLGLTVRLLVPTLLVALGGIFSFRIKVFPLGLEGYMLAGCFLAVTGTYLFGSPYLGMAFAAILVMLLALIFAFFVIELSVNPVICAFAINTIVAGMTRFLMIPVFGSSGRIYLDSALALPRFQVPIIKSIPIVADIFNNHSALVYVALLLPFVIQFVYYKTNYGLSLRATGAYEEAAVAVGISTRKVRYIALMTTGCLAGLGGAQLSLTANLFNVGMTDGRGFTALAAIVLSAGEPIRAFLGCILFGLCDALVLNLSSEGIPIQFLSMLPYILAILFAVMPPVIRKLSERTAFSKLQLRIRQNDPEILASRAFHHSVNSEE